MKLAIIFGGSSYEHEISIVSAITLKGILKTIEPIFIFVDSSRDFYLIDKDNMKSKFFSSREYLKKGKKLSIIKGGFETKGLLKSKPIDFDVALNLIHGRDGEDGKMASILEFFDIKYIGPRVEASVLSYNKLYTKWLAKHLGIQTIDYITIKKGEEDFKIPFNYPIIIKPIRLGSSIGVSVVEDESKLNYALDVAFEFDDEVLVEPFIEGIKEYNLAGCYTTEWKLSILEEPKKDDFLDFETKYLDFSRDGKIEEANVTNGVKDAIESAFKKIYLPLFKGAIIRCDFFVKDREVYLNEINPIPGSMANYLFDNFEDLLKEIATNLHKEKNININYLYINNIQKAKGKV